MAHVLSLIAADAKTALGAADADRARRALDQVDAETSGAEWLAPAAAVEFPFEGSAESVRNAARAAFAGLPVDVNVVPAAGRRKRLLIADMDSTMIRQECIDELAAEIGLRDAVAAITERAMRGEIAFAPALRERVALLAGLPVETVDKVLAARIEIMPGALTLVATMHAAGAHATLVSGGFSAFVAPIAERIGFDDWRANMLHANAGRFTGRVAEPILGAEAKQKALAELAALLSISPAEALAVGDGANDAGMVRDAGLGVAYRAKPALRAVAHATVDHGDLTALLFLQGYRRDEFITPP